MSWYRYVWFHCILTGWDQCHRAFQMWCDLMTDNYEHYAILDSDDPFECCQMYFWDELEDDIMPKEYIEYLIDLMHESAENCVTIEELEEM